MPVDRRAASLLVALCVGVSEGGRQKVEGRRFPAGSATPSPKFLGRTECSLYDSYPLGVYGDRERKVEKG